MVTRDRIDQPTPGFSVRGRKQLNLLINHGVMQAHHGIFLRITPRYAPDLYRYGQIIFHGSASDLSAH